MKALKKQIIIWSGVLLLAVIAAIMLPRLKLLDDAGYVLIGWGQWELELTLVTLILIFVIGFLLLYSGIRLINLLLQLPAQRRQRKEIERMEASHRALLEGLQQSAEGNWEQAEKALIENAAVSGQSLVHYLTAAHAAHHRGAARQRDEYLKQAYEAAPDGEVAIRVTEAEFHLSNQEFERALQCLLQVRKIAPNNARVLRLLHQVYGKLEDWEGLRKLLPALHKNKVLMEAEVKLQEIEAISALIKQKSKVKDVAGLKGLWNDLPEHVKKTPGLQATYFAAMIENGAGPEIEPHLRAALEEKWQETLVVLYGAIEMENAAEQLSHAEAWLQKYPDDAVLLRVLGKLALRAGDSEKALDYLTRSLEQSPTVEAYRLLGDLFMKKGETEHACECFRRGLMLASKAVIEEIEAHPEGVGYKSIPS